MKKFAIVFFFLLLAVLAFALPNMSFDSRNNAIVNPPQPQFTNGATVAIFLNSTTMSNLNVQSITIGGQTYTTLSGGGSGSSGGTNFFPLTPTAGYSVYWTYQNGSNVAYVTGTLTNSTTGNASTATYAFSSTNATTATNALNLNNESSSSFVQSTNSSMVGTISLPGQWSIVTNAPSGSMFVTNQFGAGFMITTNGKGFLFAITNGTQVVSNQLVLGIANFYGQVLGHSVFGTANNALDDGNGNESIAGNATVDGNLNVENGTLNIQNGNNALITGNLTIDGSITGGSFPTPSLNIPAVTNNTTFSLNLNNNLSDSNKTTLGPVGFTNGASITEDYLGDLIFSGEMIGNAGGMTNLGGSFSTQLTSWLSPSAASVFTQVVNSIVYGNASINGNTVLTNLNVAGTSAGTLNTNIVKLTYSGIPQVNVIYNWSGQWYTNSNGSGLVYSTSLGSTLAYTNGVYTGFFVPGGNLGSANWIANTGVTFLSPPQSGWGVSIDATVNATTATAASYATNALKLGGVSSNGYFGLTFNTNIWADTSGNQLAFFSDLQGNFYVSNAVSDGFLVFGVNQQGTIAFDAYGDGGIGNGSLDFTWQGAGINGGWFIQDQDAEGPLVIDAEYNTILFSGVSSPNLQFGYYGGSGPVGWGVGIKNSSLGVGVTNLYAMNGVTVVSNTWNLVIETNGMPNWSGKLANSNGVAPVWIFNSNGVAIVNYLATPGGGILP